MLSRAVLRSSRLNVPSRSPIPSQQSSWQAVSLAISLSRHASSKSPSKPSIPSSFTSQDRAQNPQASRVKDSIPAKNSPTQKNAGGNARSPVEGKRVQDSRGPAHQQAINQAQSAQAREPVAQQADLDTPPSGGIRDDVSNRQAQAENTPPPPEAPQQPLPDLRQGIPSTFDFEFGQGKSQKASKAEDIAGLDVTVRDAGSSGKRGGSDEEDAYSRADFQTSIDRRRARLTRYTYFVVAMACVFGGAYFTRPFGSAEAIPAGLDASDADGWVPGKMYRRVRARIGDRLGYYTEPAFPQLLPTVPDNQKAPYTLVLSLEDLMVHSTWDRANGYRMAKRPGIDYFIRYLSPYYELVLFTTVPIGIADPIIKKLDPYHFIMWPLGREATKYENGGFVKDLSYLNRDLNKTLIIDTVAGHVKNQPENAIVLPKWSGDAKDPHTNDLVALIPFLEYVATMSISDVREVIRSFEGKHIPTEFARREAIAREEFNKQLNEQRGKQPKRSLGSLFGGGLGIKADRSGSMMLSDGQSVAEGLAQGKMLSDQIREQGQRQYEFLEKQIQEQGAQWLKDEEDEQKRMMDEQMKEIKKNPLGSFARFFGGEPPKPAS